MRRLALLLLVACGGGMVAPDDAGLLDDGAIVADAESDAAHDAGADAGHDAAGDAGAAAAPADVGVDAAVDAGAPLGPPYPIVFAHGFFGFDDFAGAGFVTYFWGVREHLEARGEQVFFTEVDPFASSAARGAQLAEQVFEILAETGHARVNLVGHSQGGLDARVVAHDYPDRVASVVTIATPHRGTPIADIILRIIASDRLQELADALVRLLAGPIWDAAGDETSIFDSLRQLSTEGARRFNVDYPNRAAVRYWSITGRSERRYAITACRSDGRAPPFIRRWDSALDPLDPLLTVPAALINGTVLDPKPNDGLVRVEDARWGTFLGCIPADHLDEVGQLFGDSPGLLNPFDHLEFYAELVEWLRLQGL